MKTFLTVLLVACISIPLQAQEEQPDKVLVSFSFGAYNASETYLQDRYGAIVRGGIGIEAEVGKKFFLGADFSYMIKNGKSSEAEIQVVELSALGFYTITAKEVFIRFGGGFSFIDFNDKYVETTFNPFSRQTFETKKSGLGPILSFSIGYPFDNIGGAIHVDIRARSVSLSGVRGDFNAGGVSIVLAWRQPI